MAFKKYYIVTFIKWNGRFKFTLNYRTRGRIRRATLVRFNKRLIWRRNKTV
jgi:hypothetical protein